MEIIERQTRKMLMLLRQSHWMEALVSKRKTTADDEEEQQIATKLIVYLFYYTTVQNIVQYSDDLINVKYYKRTVFVYEVQYLES